MRTLDDISVARLATVDITTCESSHVVTLGSAWRPGPLPLRVGPDIVADEASRSTYLRPEAARLLFGGPGQPARWWQRRTAAMAGDPWAVELVRAPSLGEHAANRYFVISHATWPGPDQLAKADTPAAGLGAIEPALAALNAGASAAGMQPAHERGHVANYRLTMLTTTDGELQAVYPGMTRAAPADQWLWFLATHATHSLSAFAYGSEPDDDLLAEHVAERDVIKPSGQWAGLILRNGSAVVGLDPDPSEHAARSWSAGDEIATPGSFFDYLEVYVRTLYTDAIVLGQAQRWCLKDLNGRLSADLGTGRQLVQLTRELELDVAYFRHRVWTSSASNGGIADRFLAVHQRQHESAEQLASVADNVAELSRATAREQERRLNGALALLTTIGLPVATLLTVAQILSPSSQTRADRASTLVLALLGAAAMMVVLLVLFSGLRLALADSLPSRRSSGYASRPTVRTGARADDG